MWRYAGYDFSEEMQMCLLILAVYGVVRGTPKAIVTGGVGFAGLFLVKLVYAAFFPLFLLYLITRPGELRHRIRNAGLFTFPFTLAGCCVAWLNLVRFGNALESGYGSEARQFFPFQVWHTVPQLLGSLDKGLFIFCPILILGVFGWRDFASRHRPEAVLCGGLLVGNLILAGAWHSWEGGWSWGPRLLVPAIPLWLLPAAFWFTGRHSRARLWICALLTLTSILVQIPGVLADQEVHYIKQDMLTAQEQRSAPPDSVAAYILLRHKLTVQNEVYRVSEFHIPGDRGLDLTRQSKSFIGLNVWTEHLATQLNKPALRWFPALVLFPIGYLAMNVGLTLRLRVKRRRIGYC
jgi:hypothetical protein